MEAVIETTAGLVLYFALLWAFVALLRGLDNYYSDDDDDDDRGGDGGAVRR